VFLSAYFLYVNMFCVITFIYYCQYFYIINKNSIDHIPCTRLCYLYRDINPGSHNSRKSCCTQPLFQGSARHPDLEFPTPKYTNNEINFMQKSIFNCMRKMPLDFAPFFSLPVYILLILSLDPYTREV
jgi:hypothetical protein